MRLRKKPACKARSSPCKRLSPRSHRLSGHFNRNAENQKGERMNEETFSFLFKVGDEINSGGPPERANAARLQVLSIEEGGVRYKSIKSKYPKLLRYTTLDVVIAGFDRIDPDAIQRTIQPVYLDAGQNRNEFTENYEYGFAREFRRRQERSGLRRQQQ